MSVTEQPWLRPPRRRWRPIEMTRPPVLDAAIPAGPVQSRYALLINPFYPKDPNASFGKHVLTPTLALTSFAATTPEHWEVQYWDENLLDGRPPFAPMPEVVGITVHLTFARRAFELAQWYRSRGSKVVLGGLHVLSCPEECAPYADALAVGDGVQLWPRILADVESGCLRPKYTATYESDYRQDPAPRRSILPRKSFLTTTSLIATRGCHNRCGFCYLATDGLRMPYRMRDPHQVAAEFVADEQPYAVFIDNNLGSNRAYLRELCQALRPLNKIWSAAVSIDVTDDPALIRTMALAGCTGVFVGFESLTDENLADARKKTPKTADYARRVRMLHENGIQVNGSFVLGFDHDRKDVFTRTADWIEENRLECATFHILTPIRRRRCSGKWKRRGVCCTAIGLCTTRRTRCSVRKTCRLRNWNKVMPGCTSASSHTLRFGGAGPRIGAPLLRIWRCRTCTSAPTGSGDCSSNTIWCMPRGAQWSNCRDSGT